VDKSEDLPNSQVRAHQQSDVSSSPDGKYQIG